MPGKGMPAVFAFLPVLAAGLAGCLSAAGAGCADWIPDLEVGSTATYRMAGGNLLHLQAIGTETVPDGLGHEVDTIRIDARQEYDDGYDLRSHWISKDTGLPVRTMEAPGPDHVETYRYLQPRPDWLLHEWLWGPMAYALHPAFPGFTEGHLGEDWDIRWAGDQERTATIRFPQEYAPGEVGVREASVVYECGDPFPVAFSDLVGLGHGFSGATLLDFTHGDPLPLHPTGQPIGALHALARPATDLEETLTHDSLPGTLQEAVAAARTAPRFQTQWAPAHPDHFVAAAYVDGTLGERFWTVQFVELRGTDPYAIEVESWDVRLAGLDTPAGAAEAPIQEGSLRTPPIAEYGRDDVAPWGFATLDHAAADALSRWGPGYRLALTSEYEALRPGSVLESTALFYSGDEYVEYSAVDGQVLQDGVFDFFID